MNTELNIEALSSEELEELWEDMQIDYITEDYYTD
jgi:hypothetical protein